MSHRSVSALSVAPVRPLGVVKVVVPEMLSDSTQCLHA
jgi:hypothetical protein